MSVTFAIETHELTKHYGGRVAVDALSLRVPFGAVTGFVGPNGAGKTTTIRMLLGLIRPSAGTALVLGKPLTDPAAYLERVGSLVDGPAFYPQLSGHANLTILERLSGAVGGVEQALASTGLAGRGGDAVGSYSLGMRQRLALAAALLHGPDLVILDEPTNGLDPAGIREIRDLLRQLADRGVAVLVSSHQLAELEQISDQLVLLRSGKLVYQGVLADLQRQHPTQVSARPERPSDIGVIESLAATRGWEVRLDDGRVVIVGAPPGSSAELNRMAHASGVTLAELSTEPPKLEDIFFALTERERGQGGRP